MNIQHLFHTNKCSIRKERKNGFSTGSVSGAVGGALKGAGQIINAAGKWDKGSKKSAFNSMQYHYSKHVVNDGFQKGNNIINYTNDAINFSNRNIDSLQFANPSRSTMTPAFKSNYSTGYSGGWFTKDGKILTFWYK